MDHPLISATIRLPDGRQAWSAISPAAVGTLHLRTKFSVENGSELVIRRDLLDGHGEIHHTVIDFSLACDDAPGAEVRLEAARKLNSSEVLIGKAVLLLGGAWLAKSVEEVAAEIVATKLAEDRAALEAAELDATLSRQIGVYFKGGKTEPRLELRRGNSDLAIWSIIFSEVWERDRFWDWLKWQRPRFHEFVEELASTDHTTLRSRLLREMLETEQAARKSKLTTSGRRPLRFWCGEVE